MLPHEHELALAGERAVDHTQWPCSMDLELLSPRLSRDALQRLDVSVYNSKYSGTGRCCGLEDCSPVSGLAEVIIRSKGVKHVGMGK